MRIVSLCPSLTELVFDLGCGAELVGITEWCVHPADGVGRVEKVGGTKTARVDRIVELAPDLVLINREENRLEDAAVLTEAGIPCHVSMPRDPAETAAMVRAIGKALERPERAEAIARRIERRSARVRRAAAGRPRVRFACLIWSRPWMTVNADTFVHSLLAQAGGVNVFGGRSERYPEIGLDDLAAARPDLVLLTTEPYPFDERHAADLAAETGIPQTRFRVVDGELMSWHGSRTPAGIEYAAAVIESGRGG